MKIYQTLDRDPRTSGLANSGQARIRSSRDPKALAELKAELETFVCDGQYGLAIERILQSYLRQLDRPRQDAAWVSGFFGSGKSHLLKMLGHLWVDTPFPDGSTARSLVQGLSEDIRALLRELDTQVKRSGVAAVAAAGTLPAGTGELVRATVLSIILRACGLPEAYPQARFCFWLREQGFLEAVRSEVEEAGKEWEKELLNLYASPILARAVLKCDPNFAADEREARRVLREQFPVPRADLTTAEFLDAARRALAPTGTLPLTILVLDEVQQYLGDSVDRSVVFTEVAEAIETQLDSRVLLVASGQSALTEEKLLQKLRDRFRIAVQLSDADVEVVTRKVLLRKKPSAREEIRALLDRHAGEVSKHLQGTRLAERTEDRRTILADYPLLPTRRRFWEECFRSVDRAGTHSQLRSQLRILHEALRDVAEEDLGRVIPADALFDAIAPDLLNSGMLLNEINNRIQALDDGTAAGRLRKRLCGLAFLVSKLPRDPGVDTGLRATPAILADLLVEDLRADSGPFRQEVAKELAALAEAGTLMKVGEEYRLQTTEGAEWDGHYRERLSALGKNDPEIETRRNQLFTTAVQKAVSTIRLTHGAAKVSRSLQLFVGAGDPPADGEQIVVWLRDGWSATQKEVENEARRRGAEDPVIHVFLPRRAADDLRSRILEAEAARQVLDAQGAPSTDAGREARESMESRRLAAEAARDELVREIVQAAKVVKGGGTEVFAESLEAKLRAAAEASLSRLFPRFDEADHKAWGVAFRRSKEGSDHPFTAVDWDKAVEDHPVSREVLAALGSGASGGEVRKKLQAAPFGWPKDAIDAALVALHRSGTLRVVLNGQALAPGQLDQTRIQKAQFQVVPEQVRLGTRDKLILRGLFQSAGLSGRAGEEESAAAELLRTLQALAERAGGPPPLPPPPAPEWLVELRSLQGNELLAAMLERKDDLEEALRAWPARADLAEQRRPRWELLLHLAECAASLPVHAEVAPEIEAIRSQRTLLEAEDPTVPLQAKLGAALRVALKERIDELRARLAEAQRQLAADPSWSRLGAEDQAEILARHGLQEVQPPAFAGEEELLQVLAQRPLGSWADAVAAVPERVRAALEEAVRRLQPQARRIALSAATLETEEQVKAWLAEQEQTLLAAIQEGPVIVG
ncbi:MAG: BREX system P-loop protein BrxC [Planctomycetota bacterium]|nr:MAG: BREX system P-loop protein BrxC [Planctomycetota bacterium]